MHTAFSLVLFLILGLSAYVLGCLATVRTGIVNDERDCPKLACITGFAGAVALYLFFGLLSGEWFHPLTWVFPLLFLPYIVMLRGFVNGKLSKIEIASAACSAGLLMGMWVL